MWNPFRKSKTIDQIALELDEGRSRRSAGQIVNRDTALEVTTVLACVDAIATGCAVPDLHVMRDLGNGQKERARDHPSYRVLHRRPNEWQTAMEFRETLTMHAALTGNGYAIPTRDDDGNLLELLPVLPSMVLVNQPRRYEIEYTVTDEFGVIGVFRHDQIFHLRNRSWDRVKGLDAVAKARAAIGLSMAAEQNISDLQAHGGKPGGLLTTDQRLNEATIKRLKEAWEKGTTGKNAYRTPVLDAGIKYSQMAMTAVDQQTLETRRLQVEEICRAFGVFPQIVMHTDKTATFASAEAFFAAHTRLTVGKWQKNWREKLDEFVLDGAGPLFVEFDNRILDGASLKDRGEYYAKALGAGGGPPWMTQNEVRAELGLPPKEGGDELFKPTNAVIGETGDENEPDSDQSRAV